MRGLCRELVSATSDSFRFAIWDWWRRFSAVEHQLQWMAGSTNLIADSNANGRNV
jgi:hypothetical protein